MRWLISPSPYGQGHRLGMIWLQEPGGPHRIRDEHDGVIDGDHPGYLHSTADADEDLRSLDPSLYDQLRLMAAHAGRPVTRRETCRALPADTVRFDRPLRFDDIVRDDRAARAVSRQRWFHEAMVAVASCSLVFVDSDDGLVRDDGQQALHEHADGGIWMSEVDRLLERGQSVVTHHLAHLSQPLAESAETQLGDVHDALGVEPLVLAQRSPGGTRLFTVIPHHRHRPDLQDRIGALQLSRWGDEFRVHRWHSAHATV